MTLSLTFWPNVNWWARYRDYLFLLYAKFGHFNFSRFGFIVRTDRITEEEDRYTHATTVGVTRDWTGDGTTSRLSNIKAKQSNLIYQ